MHYITKITRIIKNIISKYYLYICWLWKSSNFSNIEVSRTIKQSAILFFSLNIVVSWSSGRHIANGQACVSVIWMYTSRKSERASMRTHTWNQTWCVLFQHCTSKLVNWKSSTMFFIHRKVRSLNYAIFQFCICIAYFHVFGS